MELYLRRNYRNKVFDSHLSSYEVKYKESDLFILTRGIWRVEALIILKKLRSQIEEFINNYPDFRKKMEPMGLIPDMPDIIKIMTRSAKKAGVGPMAAVAGAIAQKVGGELMKYSEEVIVENGGDIFLKINSKRTAAIFAGPSPFSMKIGIKLKPLKRPYGLCTSSGTVGHSISYGNADAVACLAEDAALADACATAIGNVVIDRNDIKKGLKLAEKITGLWGCLIIMGDEMGAVGDVELCKIK